MAFVGIGCEIGNVNVVVLGRVAQGERFAVVFSMNAKPCFAVVTGDSLIVFPALGVGAPPRIFQLERECGVAHIMDAEIKPLPKFAGVISADIEADVVWLAGINNLDCACVKLAGDMHGVVISNNAGFPLARE